jgi:hypothetical protein
VLGPALAAGRDVIRLDNFAEFTQGIEAWIDEMEELAEQQLQALAVGAFEFILQGTPEWTGNLAASWRLTVGAPAQGYDASVFKHTGWERLSAPGTSTPSPYSRQAPNEAALNYARAIAKEQIPLIRLGAPVYITNNTPYAVEVESNVRKDDGKRFIRGVNLPIEMVHAAVDKFGGI